MSLHDDDNGVPYIQIGKHKIKLETEELNEKLKRKSEKELRETPENVEIAFKELRALISEEPDFYVPMELDEYLIKFLRPCKFYSDSAFLQMQKFYRFKQKHPQYCEGLSPNRDRNMFKQGIVSFQEARDDNGSRIMTIQSGVKWKPSLCSLGEMFRGIQIALEAAMIEPSTQVGGVVVILDMRGFSLNHVVQFTPSFAKMVVDWIQDCIPLRLKGVHIINQPYVFNMVFALFKPFLRAKLRNRIHFHGENRESLMKFIPSRALSTEHGGTMDMPEVPGGLLCDLLCKYEDDYALANTFGYNRKVPKET